MKFTSKERKLVSSQKTMTVELGLADQKKAIELLYSQYTKPIQTCVQELVSNAFDAMRDAGRSHVPIKITVPSVLNEFYFSVRDYGNSMDDYTIKNVYMRVNASTKANDNKDLGGFGIGSKTPWAYTDTFILKTFLNGLETQYALVKGRSTVSIVYQGKTEEEDGTEVIFKTKERDKDDFIKAVRRISLCAKTKPIVNIKDILTFDKEDILSPHVKVVKTGLLYSGIYLSVGGVLYWIDYGALKNSNTPYNSTNVFRRIQRMLKESTLIISVPVGAITPLQTREGFPTKGEEGQQNKSMVKRLLSYAYEVLESTMAARKKMVVNASTAVDFFSGGMLVSHDRFAFGKLEVTNRGFALNGNNLYTELSRSKARGYGKTVKAKKLKCSYLLFKDLEKCPVFFSELSPNKARLINRLNGLCVKSDVIVLEKRLFEDLDIYNFLKSHTGARDVEEVEIEKGTSSNKGKKKDANKVVFYTYWGERYGSIDLTNLRGVKYVIAEKGTSVPFSSRFYAQLGYKLIYVAGLNYKKLQDHENFYLPEEVIDLAPFKDRYIKLRFREAVLYNKSLKRENVSYIKDLVDSNKQNLFRELVYVDKSVFTPDLIDSLEEKYGNSIDRTLKKMLKQRVRANFLVDKVPLVQHIGSATHLNGQAKKDLDNYVTTNIGG